jgi:hypothetical protein
MLQGLGAKGPDIHISYEPWWASGSYEEVFKTIELRLHIADDRKMKWFIIQGLKMNLVSWIEHEFADEILQIFHCAFGRSRWWNTLTPRYPKGGACEENQLEKYACRTLYSDRNRFIFYLCLGWAGLICGMVGSIQESRWGDLLNIHHSAHCSLDHASSQPQNRGHYW